ncbi:hypothetical protein IU510_17270 [Nocardia cyriacigeorgica]|uniref:hypothetical protein n=1 Tax=Nocardia cyriacigeorgica TaxID=135487 RepID=UPI0018952BDF|nr:hypothetical protein [Nocardia cyriacigeorgica]MBF6099821.1 hypothetical protein [Nocardia cyriacigeorgica]MBF6316176.1 hypothetical protein [Nocardia cyriacigeorgica]MBF6530961.1 hypothetical protein [Nocardia cyriacigeorgica]
MAEPAPPKQWRPEYGTVYDPAPTRPVMRSELERETGSWPTAPAAAWGTAAPADHLRSAEHGGSVVDLDELRRKRAGDDAAPDSGARRVPKPRRIGEQFRGEDGNERNRDDGSATSPSGTRAGRHRR